MKMLNAYKSLYQLPVCFCSKTIEWLVGMSRKETRKFCQILAAKTERMHFARCYSTDSFSRLYSPWNGDRVKSTSINCI